MEQFTETLTIQTNGPGLVPITEQVRAWLATLEIDTGVLTIFIAHTSASLTIQENADPDVCRDLEDFFDSLVKKDPSLYRHTMEGPDDMPAHIRAALTQTNLSIPVKDGQLHMGAWQGLYVFEHRDKPHTRQIYLTYQGT